MIEFTVTLVVGVGGTFALAWAADLVVGRALERWRAEEPRRRLAEPRSCVRVLHETEAVDWERLGWA